MRKEHAGIWKQCWGLSVPFTVLFWNCSCFPGHLPLNSRTELPKSILVKNVIFGSGNRSKMRIWSLRVQPSWISDWKHHPPSEQQVHFHHGSLYSEERNKEKTWMQNDQGRVLDHYQKIRWVLWSPCRDWTLSIGGKCMVWYWMFQPTYQIWAMLCKHTKLGTCFEFLSKH